MIINLNLKLSNNKQLRKWTDTDNIPEWRIKRLLFALSNTATLDEQLSILDGFALNNDYNPSGEVTMYFIHGEREIQVCDTNYDSTTGMFRRGAIRETITF